MRLRCFRLLLERRIFTTQLAGWGKTATDQVIARVTEEEEDEDDMNDGLS